MNNTINRIESLPESRWQECRDLRLLALREEPLAFGSSFEEEEMLSESTWKSRSNNAIFALEDNIPIGMVVFIHQTSQKSMHIGNIYGLFVKKSQRGKGVGKQLIEKAILKLREHEHLRKIKLTVNCEQEAAITLYKKLGFSAVGTLRKELLYRNSFYDELMMELLF